MKSGAITDVQRFHVFQLLELWASLDQAMCGFGFAA